MSKGDGASHRPSPRCGRRVFIAALGVGQIVSWGSLYYSFPLMAGPMADAFHLTKPEVYAAATVGLAAASLAAVPVGLAIDRGYGRGVMAAGSALGAVLLVAWSQLTAGWMLYPLFVGIGIAQAMTLYEPAFAVIARSYGTEARAGITSLTLWGGFASTVFVPLLQLLLDTVGWRQAVLVLAVLNLLGVILSLAVIERRAELPATSSTPLVGRRAIGWALCQPAFWSLLVAFTAYYGVFSALTFHLYPLLLERGFDTAEVVGAIAIIGPAQVAGRVVIWLFAARRPINAVGAVTVLGLPVALVLFWLLPPRFVTLAVFAIVYGAANGVMTIVRGLAVPEMLTREAYGAINGILAMSSTAAKAVAPVAAAVLWSASGSYDAVLAVAFVGSVIVAVGFWFAVAMHRSPA